MKTIETAILHRLWFLSMVLFVCTARSVELTPSEREALCRDAEAYFSEGLELKNAGQATDAMSCFDKAIARYERVEESNAFINGKILYNLGNAYLMKDDIGRAILSYRKAETLIPHDSKLQANLAVARARRVDQIKAAETAAVVKTLFSLHDVPLVWREGVLLVAFAGFWTGLLALLRFHAGWLKGLTGVCCAVALLSAVSVAFTWHDGQLKSGVILAETAGGRKGGSDAYERSFEQPLHAGTEVTVLHENGRWLEVRLENGATCWLQRDAVGVIQK